MQIKFQKQASPYYVSLALARPNVDASMHTQKLVYL